MHLTDEEKEEMILWYVDAMHELGEATRKGVRREKARYWITMVASWLVLGLLGTMAWEPMKRLLERMLGC